jgi:hypothetical protein
VVEGVRSRRAALVTSLVLIVVFGALAPATRGSQTGFDESLSNAPLPAKQRKIEARLAAKARGAASVRVELTARRPAAVRALVAGLGGSIEASYGRLVEATIPSERLDSLASDSSVQFASKESPRPAPPRGTRPACGERVCASP